MSTIDTAAMQAGFEQLKAIAERLDPGCNPNITLTVTDRGNGSIAMYGRGFKFRRWLHMPVADWAIGDALDRAQRHMAIVAENWDLPDADVESQLRAAGCLT